MYFQKGGIKTLTEDKKAVKKNYVELVKTFVVPD